MGVSRGARQSIKDLVRSIACADNAAFDRLYRQLSPRLMRSAERGLGDPEIARDIVWDTFVQVWSTAGSYDPKRGSAVQWIELICRSRVIECRRSLSRKQRIRAAYEGLSSADASCVETDPADQLQRLQESTLLQHSIERLPSQRRQALILSFYRDLSHSHIADSMRIPLGTVKAGIRRALLSLKDQTQHHFQ